ncbi:histidine phosphatase family protein [Leucobacter sp. 1207-22]|uniref:histidine phosphatase family protein n=1 Tax=Leucobacter sp. 1207-22 TaxID=2604456 RepID=UPI004062D6B5
MTLLRLVRHGETDWNLAGRIQGQTDVPLNDTGRLQALATAEQLAGVTCDRIISSTLGRAIETARIISAHLELTVSEVPPVETEAALCEQSWGDAEGCLWDAVEARFPDGLIPGRESHVIFMERATAALRRISYENAAAVSDGASEASVLVVTHGGVIDALCRHVSAADGEPFAKSGNGSITAIRVTPEGKFLRA